jgi:hypothetical protein
MATPGRDRAGMRYFLPIAACIAAVALAGCSAASSSSSSSAPAAAVTTHKAKPKPCKLKTKFDYIERTTEPGIQAQALEIGNVDLVNCTASLKDFQATAGQADGECTTIAKASDNPGYDAEAIPAPRLKHVIESAGPGC